MLALVMCFPLSASDWFGNKYSMFIHFGVYSSLGGVWKGKPVTYGYSEQIQACGGIYADWYHDVAEAFDPADFDADAIVALAKDAGMRSIVITSKHHDGFCMWGTKTTDYNSVDLAACGRDFMKELSEACERGGVNLGLYFSLIDWNLPYNYTMTSHNSDFILPPHHEYNKAQVRELLTGYGKISELWFDMGSLTPQQSKELYDLVHELQPGCMVSGRLGNDQYDFAVMGDNSYPESSLQTPWQTCASMFDETWGYRSWQVRGDVREKAAEKLRSLVGVVAHGGNYLLNIGPDDKGAVVPFEAEVLRIVGKWVAANADVIYDTKSSPYREDYSWGVVTRKGASLNLILSGKCPEDGYVRVPDPDRTGKILSFAVTAEDFSDPCSPKVIRHQCRKEVADAAPSYLPAGTKTLYEANAVRDYSYSCVDYYTNYMSTIAFNWYLKGKASKTADILFTASEKGRKVLLEADGQASEFVLDGAEIPSMTAVCEPLDTTIKAHIMRSYPVERKVTAPAEGDYLFEVGAGNSILVRVNGRQVCRHLNAYRVPYTSEYILLHLQAGENIVKIYGINRFEKTVRITFAPSEGPLYRMTVPVQMSGSLHQVKISDADKSDIHRDCMLHNLRISLR